MDVVELETMCRAIAPIDLSGMPLYILPASRLTPDRGGDIPAGACTSSILDLLLRDAIGDEWQDRGPCMMINDVAIAEDYKYPAWRLHGFRAVAAHELVHILERPHPFATPARDLDAAELVELSRSIVAAFKSVSATATYPDTEREHHGIGFTRLAVHVCDRYQRAGYDFPIAHIITAAYTRPRFAGLHEYRKAMRRELRSMAKAPFSAIRAKPIPPAFREVFEADAAPEESNP